MNIHSRIDTSSLKLAASLRKNLRYFSEAVSSRPVVELAEAASIQDHGFPALGYSEYRCQVGSLVTDPGVLYRQKGSKKAPLVIYHHGAAEGKYTYSFDKLFGRKSFKDTDVKLMAIKAPWCRNNKEFFSCISSLERYTAMIASSVALIEMLITEHRKRSASPVIVTGMSLGGLVSCLHATVYGSADRYIPILAGPQVGDLFIDSAYAVMTDEKAKKEKPKSIREALNFGEEFLASGRQNVYPVLGRYDRIFLLESQLPYYDQSHCTIIDKGHSSGATSVAILSSILYDTIRTEGKL